LNRKIFILIVGAIVIAGPAFAREFNSRLKLKVFVREAGDVPDRLIGFTPHPKNRRILVPDGKIWYVRPVGALSGIRLQDLAREMKQSAVPGLDLSDHWELSDESLRHLAELSQLQMLDLSRTRISDQGMVDVKPFPRLSVLILPAGITDRAAAPLASMPSLRELGLDHARLTDRGLAEIACLPALETLDLSNTRVTNKGLAALRKLPTLRRLTLGAQISDGGAAHLAKLHSLQEIDVSQTQIGEKGLAALALLPNLRSASLGRGVTDRGLAQLARSPSLKVLDLSHTPVTDEGVKSVSRMKTLEELALSQTAIGDQSLTALAQMPELRILDLSDTKVTTAGLMPLAHLRKLQIISLSWRKLTQDDLQGMAWLKQVKTIVLNGVPLPEATMAQLRRLTPREPFASLGTGSLLDARPASPLGKPLAASIPALRPGSLPEIPKTSGAPITAPSARGKFSSEEKAASSQALVGRTLRGPAEGFAPQPLPFDNARAAAAPTEVAPKGKDDNLLQVIKLQSNPSRAGPFAGLSGMRQLQRSKTVASLNTLATGGSQPSVPLEEDKPENSLGEISVGVRPSH